MFENSADVIQRGFAQIPVAVAVKDVFAIFENGLMHMHPAAVFADQWFGHKSGGKSMVVRDIFHHIFKQLHLVGFLGERAETGADFALAGGADFVVMHFHIDAHFRQSHAHQRAYIGLAVHRRHGKISALDIGTMAGVAAVLFVFLGGIPRGFGGINVIKRAAHFVRPAHRIKQEKLVFGAKECLVAYA